MALRPASPEGDTRQQILQRAITLFAGAGYAGVSVRDVAAQVGISAAALYHHFPDKQALYLAAMEHAFARNESGILAALESERSPLERLSGFVTGFVALAAGDQEFSFSAADFDRVRELIYQRAGISLHAGKQAMVYSRLSRRLRETSHRSFAAYLQWLQANTGPSGDAEWQEFVNCLTTNLTAFFREEHHFHALVDDLKAIASKNAYPPQCCR